ncbi:MAG: hypothetical protein AAGC71_04265 [Pseudomonadota bacterium]
MLHVVSRIPGPDSAPDENTELQLLCAALRVPGERVSPAAARAAASNIAITPQCVCIDAVFLSASLDDLILQCRPTDLGQTDAERLVELIRETAAGRLTDVTLDEHGFGTATLIDVEPPRGIDPARAYGLSLRRTLLRGRPAALATLDAELQMALHNWSGNARRQAQGQVPINALWIWGAGESAKLPLPTQTLPMLASNDATLTAFWRLSGSGSTLIDDWRPLVSAASGGVIVPRSDAEFSAVVAALSRRSRWRSWRTPLRLYNSDFTLLSPSEVIRT